MKRMHDKSYNYKLGIIAGKISDPTQNRQNFVKEINLDILNIPNIEFIDLIQLQIPTAFGGTEFIGKCEQFSLPSSINNGINICSVTGTAGSGPVTLEVIVNFTYERAKNLLLIATEVTNKTTSMTAFTMNELILDIVYF